MIKTTFAVATILQVAQSAYIYGRCPQVKQGWKQTKPNEDLNHTALLGIWHNLYQDYRSEHMDCMVTKLGRIEDDNSTWLQFFHGLSFADINEVLYEDYIGLTFTHPNDSSLAAVSSVHDNGSIEHNVLVEMLEMEFEGNADEELLQQVDEHDIEVHIAKMRDIMNLQRHLEKVNNTGNAFINPLQVVDTDYSNFMLTYRCEEEERMFEEDYDSRMLEPEVFRIMVERDNLTIDHFHAYQTQRENADNEEFDKLVGLIKEHDAANNLTTEALEEELALFLVVDDTHQFQFDFYHPTTSKWAEIRELLLQPLNETYQMDVNFQDEPQWFRKLDYILYLRNGHNYTEYMLHNYQQLMRKIVPSFLYEYTHVEVHHSSEHCLEGDIFNHENRNKFD